MLRANERGVTMLEMLVSLALLSAFLSVVYISIANLTDGISRQRNEVFPVELAEMIKDHYLLNTYEVDKNRGSVYEMENINIPNLSLSADVSDSLTEMLSTVPYTNLNFRDGYNQPMLILVSELLEKEYEGSLIPYRVFAIVSTDNIDVVNVNTFNTTMNVTTGEVDIDPRETVVVMNTYTEQLEHFRNSQRKVSKMISAYSHYYWGRHNYQIGDISRNYFAGGAGSWDNLPGVTVLKTCDAGSPDVISGRNTPGIKVSDAGFIEPLGLSAEFELNEWGGDMYIMNCGTISNVSVGGSAQTLAPRNPDNPARNRQPFNAYIGFTMSNGESYIKTVSARF